MQKFKLKITRFWFYSISFIIISLIMPFVLPPFATMTEEAQLEKTKQDLKTIATAISKYSDEEIKKFIDPDENPYRLSSIDILRDPWGNSYKYDIPNKRIYSCGPDGRRKFIPDKKPKSLDLKHKDNKDNIYESYR